MRMSNHVKNERLDRLTYIATTVEFGEPVLERVYADKRECVTSTGVVMVTSPDGTFLITAFIGTVKKISAMYREAGYSQIPLSLYRVVADNKIHVILQNMTEEERKSYLRTHRKKK